MVRLISYKQLRITILTPLASAPFLYIHYTLIYAQARKANSLATVAYRQTRRKRRI